MIISEKTVAFPMSQREFNLVREMAGEFMLDFPDAEDVASFVERLTEFYFKEFKQ